MLHRLLEICRFTTQLPESKLRNEYVAYVKLRATLISRLRAELGEFTEISSVHAKTADLATQRSVFAPYGSTFIFRLSLD